MGTAGRKGLRGGRFKELANLFKCPPADLLAMTARHRVLALALALLLPVGAGCLGGSDMGSGTVEPTGGPDPSPGPGQTSSSNLTVARFPVDAPLDRVTWANGSFQPHEMCNVTGCATGSAYRTTDLTDLPAGTPVQLSVELRFDEGETIWARPLEVTVSGERASFYTYEVEEEAGYQAIATTLSSGDGPVTVEVRYIGPRGSAPPADYTLRLHVQAGPERLPAQVPAAVELAPGHQLHLEPLAEGPVKALAYGPQDQLVWTGSSDGGPLSWTLPGSASAGDHILVLRPGSAPVRVASNGTGQALHLLPLTYELGPLHDVAGPEALTWSFDVQAVPLAVGLYMVSGGPAGLGATFQPGQGTVEAPDGTPVDGELGCGICIVGSYQEILRSQLADPVLAVGTYQASYEPGGSAAMQVGHLIVGYER